MNVHLKEVWVLLFLLGVIMLNYPFVQIFNKEILVFGFPLLFLYFMIGWPASIFVVYLFSKNMHDEEENEPSDEGKGKPGP